MTGQADSSPSFDQLAATALARCDELAACSDQPGRIARTFCSPAMRDAHRLVQRWMEAAGMVCRVDAAGNLIGRLEPRGGDDARRVLIGSHLDTVIDAGRFDGILGVMAGIAAAGALREADASLPWALEVVGFSDEEGVRFGTPFLGSRLLAGEFSEAILELRDSAGTTVAEALGEFGAPPFGGQGGNPPTSSETVAYLETHIEQGRRLEQKAAPLGVVSAIAGQTRLTVRWTGPGGHAGTVPMHERSDPLSAACRWALAVEGLARETPGLVATVGRVEIDPNVANCIPRRVGASLDVRHHEDSVRERAVAGLVELAEQLAADSQLEVGVGYDHEHAAIAMDAALGESLSASVESSGFPLETMVSGAGHDAGVMAGVTPSALLFIRSPGGVSHHPDEAVTQEDVAAAIEVMVRFLQQLGS